VGGLEQRHRVFLSFQRRKGWHCQFLEEDLQTPLPASCILFHLTR
jgi:hypothetical protein